MIFSLFVLIIFTSLLVLGWTIVTQEEMLLHGIRVWAEGRNKKWLEPLVLCHWCQPSIWSLFGYFFAIITGVVHVELRIVYLYPLVVCGSSIVCGFVWTAYLVMNREMQYYETLINQNNEIEEN